MSQSPNFSYTPNILYRTLATTLLVAASSRALSQFFEFCLQDSGERKPFAMTADQLLHGFCTQ
ncbi:MAG: hypothetical protein EBZ75_12670 [Oxalobacteraceae bacterium]|nr:hypothetical protein [Oxalobacteraceae bacterium]